MTTIRVRNYDKERLMKMAMEGEAVLADPHRLLNDYELTQGVKVAKFARVVGKIESVSRPTLARMAWKSCPSNRFETGTTPTPPTASPLPASSTSLRKRPQFVWQHTERRVGVK